MQPEGSDVDSLDVCAILQIVFTLPEKDWCESALGYLNKLPSYLWPSEAAGQRISTAEVLSRWPYDTTVVPLHPTAVDPREVLSILVALSYTISPFALRNYVVLLLNSYRQVLFGNMRRRLNSMKELPSSPKGVLHARNSVLLSMKPWARDIIELLERNILPSLVVQDANPKTVEAGIDSDGLDSNLMFRAHIGASERSDCKGGRGAVESAQHTNNRYIEDLNFFWGLIVDLLQDMAHSSTLRDTCARCALSLYGAMWSSMTLCRGLTIGGVPVSERIKGEYQRINAKSRSSDFLTEAELPSDGFVLSSTERAALRETIFKFLCTALNVESSAEALLQLLWDEADNSRFDLNEDFYFFDDWGEDSRPPISKTLTLWQERVRALEKLQLWNLPEPYVEEHGNLSSDEGISILVNLGLFNLLISLMTSQKEVPLLISNSPLSLFFTISSTLSRCLKCTSAAALLGVLFFLGQCIRRIPKYCIEFPGEQRDLANPIHSAEESSGYRTEEYRIFFEILKQLVSISVMCPNAIHRTISRSLTLEILECLEEQARIRTHMTLLVLTPFASVTRVLLDNVLREWDFSQNARYLDISSALLSDMPCGIVNAMGNFLQQIESGKFDFMDPLIMSLNFFRLFIVKDRSAAKPRLLIYDSSDKLILTESSADAKRVKENNSWPWAIHYLGKVILPNCRKCLSTMGRESRQKMTEDYQKFSHITLSPLEEFSLSSAVDSVSALLPAADRVGT